MRVRTCFPKQVTLLRVIFWPIARQPSPQTVVKSLRLTLPSLASPLGSRAHATVATPLNADPCADPRSEHPSERRRRSAADWQHERTTHGEALGTFGHCHPVHHLRQCHRQRKLNQMLPLQWSERNVRQQVFYCLSASPSCCERLDQLCSKRGFGRDTTATDM
jgi:hypothetical protein